MTLCLLLLSTLTLSSLAITWNDDNIISFDGDLGWKIYSKSLPTYDTCRNGENCQRFGINKYYGPFNGTDKYFLERNFECM